MNKNREKKFYEKTANYEEFQRDIQRHLDNRYGKSAGPGAFAAYAYMMGWSYDLVDYLRSDKPIGEMCRMLLAEILEDQLREGRKESKVIKQPRVSHPVATTY